jgi:hypothetical protein
VASEPGGVAREVRGLYHDGLKTRVVLEGANSPVVVFAVPGGDDAVEAGGVEEGGRKGGPEGSTGDATCAIALAI